MLAHPVVVKRLNWILGGGFRCNCSGNLIEWRGDWGEESGEDSSGHRLHGGAHPLLPEFNYHSCKYSQSVGAYASRNASDEIAVLADLWKNGRAHTGSCNIPWQLHPVGASDGGAVLVHVPGTHKASVPNFEDDPFDLTGHRGDERW